MSAQRVPYLVGDKHHVDHIYYPIDKVTTAPVSLSYPIGLTLDEYIKWAWRIKTWTFAGTASWYTHAFSDAVPGTIQVSWSVPGASLAKMAKGSLADADQEKDHVLSFRSDGSLPSPTYLTNGGFHRQDLFGPGVVGVPFYPSAFAYTGSHSAALISHDPSWGALIRVMIFQEGQHVKYDTVSKLFYPWLRAELHTEIKFTDAGHVGTQGGGFGVATDGGGDNFGSISIDGHSVPLLLSSGGFDSSPAPAVSLTLTPSEFWEYRNGLGQAVFDSASGAQINDPFV